MPGGDGTGPMGMGPMSGRAMGYCAGTPVDGEDNETGGRGVRRGLVRGFGRGRGQGDRGQRNRLRAGALGGRGNRREQANVSRSHETDDRPLGERTRELQGLKQQAESVEQQLEQLREQIEDLETAE